ncbi:MAG: nicotinate-nucleotide adenylyltransferase [Ruminococcus sp.]|uniref:nicotinate-nucleotide adenylyltransferase n=1 Tax=Ruminococcus sp. TaxID=41978 RepID=UPI001B2253AC|nr:nicotinate-nucleotide adenylyltransferase [Ruminococcus sp.]MBO7472767.1 nicotinate-nucleotide adenylyltransferase [Ruminococcus sp.]
MKTGIYGGSFNPVHNGHIHLAETAVREFGLDRLYFVPSKKSPHRSTAEYAPDEDRLEMLRLAAGADAKLFVSDYEIKSDRVSYTIYTVEHFRREFPEDELFLLVGSDMLLCFDTWHRFEEILRNVTLCVVSRESGDLPELRKKADELGKYGKIIVSEAVPTEVSSTSIRKKIAKNEDFTCYLNENVVQYIRSKGLYSVRGEDVLQYNPEDKKKILKARLTVKRYTHSLNVATECKKLAEKYGEDPDKAYFAGLLHDICKELPEEEQKALVLESGFTVCREEMETRSLLHGIAGAYYIKKEFGIEDIDILNSVRFHTVGRAGMSRLEEIVYIGDLISAERDYKDVDKMRRLAYTDLNAAMLEAFAFSMKSVIKKGGVIPICTVEGYNFYTRLLKEEKK